MEELASIIEIAKRIARRQGSSFVVNPEKVKKFLAYQERNNA